LAIFSTFTLAIPVAHAATNNPTAPAMHHFHTPPANFNPLNVSDAQLEEYGFPVRPTNPQYLSGWIAAMKTFRVMLKPTFKVRYIRKTMPKGKLLNPKVETTSNTIEHAVNPIWSGYLDYAQNATYNFTDLQGTFIASPIDSAYSSTGSHYSSWFGFGGYSGLEGHNSPYVLQSGISATLNSAGNTSFAPFWEIGGFNYEQNLGYLAIYSGDTMYVDISYTVNAGGDFKYFVENESTGKAVSGYVEDSSGYYDGTEAEAITEANSVDGQINCGDFHSVSFNNISTNSISNQRYGITDQDSPYQIFRLTAEDSNDTVLINASQPTSSSSFVTYWHNAT
jgi:hypothetical protein